MAVSRQSPDTLWLHDDGGRGRVYAVRSDGRTVLRLNVRARIDDLEDIAIGLGPVAGIDFLYLADIGDNRKNRREVRVIRFPEPSLPRAHNEEELEIKEAEVFRLRYPDRPHDAETLMIDAATGDLFIATKEDRGSRLYRAALGDLGAGGLATLEFAGDLNVGKVSGGDISRTGDWILVRSEDEGWLWTRGSGEDVADAILRIPHRVHVRSTGQGKNVKAVGFSPDGLGYYTISMGKEEAIFHFPIVVADPDASR
jgi:hypothetical protein